MKWWGYILIVVGAFGLGYLFNSWLSRSPEAESIRREFQLRDSMLTLVLQDTLDKLNKELSLLDDSINKHLIVIQAQEAILRKSDLITTSLSHQLNQANENLKSVSNFDLKSTTSEDIIWLNQFIKSH